MCGYALVRIRERAFPPRIWSLDLEFKNHLTRQPLRRIQSVKIIKVENKTDVWTSWSL